MNSPLSINLEVLSMTDSNRVAIYMHRGLFDDAKSAYLVDLDQPAGPDSFARWVNGVIDEHAARTPEQRAAIAAGLPEYEPVGSGLARSFEMSLTTIQARDSAITEDRQAGRPAVSRSEFSVEAIRHRVEVAKQLAGGTLPPAPKRLPNKPVRN